MKRTRLRAKPKLSVTDAEMSTAWFRAVVHHQAVCVGCGSKSHLQGHHIIPKTHVKAHARSCGLGEEEAQPWVWDVRNGVAVCTTCHERHTNKVKGHTIPRFRLPAAVYVFAAELDHKLGRGAPMLERIRREYPEA